MKLHAFIFACLVLGSRAASISSQADEELEKSQDVNQAIVDKAETNLRKVVEIPVAIVEEPILINKDDNVPDIKESTGVKMDMDLTNEDSNQQLQESQNVNNKKERDIVKLKIEEIRRLIDEYDKSVQKMLDASPQSKEDLAALQLEVQNFKRLFNEQLADLKSTIASYIARSNNLKTQLNSDDAPNQDIQFSLEKLKTNFDKEIDLLFTAEAKEGKADSLGSTSITQNQYISEIQNNWNTFMTNIHSHVNNIYQNHIQNYISGSKS